MSKEYELALVLYCIGRLLLVAHLLALPLPWLPGVNQTKLFAQKLARILLRNIHPCIFLLGFPNQLLDLPLEERQTIIPGPETPGFYDLN